MQFVWGGDRKARVDGTTVDPHRQPKMDKITTNKDTLIEAVWVTRAMGL